jgi:hypothetical protein
MTSSPSAGERAAVSGYSLQYLIAADLVYEQIRGGNLEWVQLVDPDAGRVDDVIVATPGRVDAYQVKWAQTKSTYTFASFTSEKGEKPSLWRQLSDGWQSVQSAHPDKRARVSFVTNEIASPNDKVSTSDGSATPFQQLWTEALVPLSHGAPVVAFEHSKYVASLSELEGMTGLERARFEEFIGNCRLQFDRPDPRQTLKDDLRRIGELSDIQQLAAYLFSRVGLARTTLRLYREELLRDLGWDARLSPRFKHHFYVDESLYRPIEPTVSELQNAVETRKFGYIALMGGPGSGKSTTLSHTLRYKSNVRLISYYAYVKNDLATGRGEAANFWQDIYLAIRQAGVDPGGSMPRSAVEFRRGVGEQFALLADEWKSRGVLTVLLIDGLDHIDREQSPTESLIAQLPLPEQIPEGVVVCLGSQTLSLRGFPASIHEHLSADGRILQMGRLSRGDVHAISESARLPAPLAPGQKDRIYSHADGYPLATMYLLGRLANADVSDIDSILQSDSPFSGDIESVYATYWAAISGAAIPELLGLLCRMRVSFDIRQAVAWVPNLDGQAFVRQTKHFFQTVEGNKWSFFHNSFRQYLLRRTSEDLLGISSGDISKLQHSRLAKIATEQDPRSVFGRESIFHLYEAGDYEAVLALATQDRFRSQFLSLRNPNQIFDDIGLVVRAARQRQDGIGLIRAWLIDMELNEREGCLDNASFRPSIDAFLDDQALIDTIRDPSGLLVSRVQAMAAIKRLYQSNGDVEVIKGIFELAEPLDLLSGVEKVKLREGDEEFLRNWLVMAFTFRRPLAIADAISNLVTDVFDADEEIDAGKQLRQSLLVELGTLTFEADQLLWKELLLHPQVAPLGTEFLAQVDWRLLEQGKTTDVRASSLQRLLQAFPFSEWYPSDRLFLAEQMRRLGFERQRILDVVVGIEQPALTDPSKHFSGRRGNGLSAFVDRIRFNRLQSALGASIAPEVAVPWPIDKKLRNGTRFERALVTVANLWGAALGGRHLDQDVAILTLKDAIRVFYTTDDNSTPASNWYFYRATAPVYFEFLIDAVAAHGTSYVSAIGREFDRIWAAKEPRSTWSTDLCRAIATSLYKSGDARELFVIRLHAIGQGEIAPDDLQSRIDSLIESARAWQLAAEPSRALALLEPTLRTSFGIHHHKDRQIQHWVDWLDRATLAGVTDPIHECCRFASALVSIVSLGRGRGAQEAVANLLAIATRVDAGFGLYLRDQLFSSGTIAYGAACQGMVQGLLGRADVDFVDVVEYLEHVGAAAEIPSVEQMLAALVTNLSRQLGTDSLRFALEPLVAAVLTEEFSSARSAWFQSLERSLRELGVDWPELKRLASVRVKESGNTPMSVKQRDGTTILDRDLEKAIVDFDSLVKAIERSEPSSYFSWKQVTKEIINSVAKGQLLILMRLLDQLGSSQHVVAAQIADRLAQLGDLEQAETLANRFLETSVSHGWIAYFDGGTRLHLARALVNMNPNRRPQLFCLLADDYVGGLRNPRDLIMALDDLLPIIFAEVPWKALWREIGEHISFLSEFAEAEPIPAPQLSDWGAKSMLIESAVRDYQLPIPEMEIRFARLLTRWLGKPESSELVVEAIERALDEGMLDAQAVVPIYMARDSLQDRSERTASLLDRLTSSSDISVRGYASAVKFATVTPENLLRAPVGDPSVLFRIALDTNSLSPPLYGLTPEFVQATTSRPREPSEFFRVWLPEMKMVEQVTDIPVQNLLERAQQIAEDLLEQSRWGKDAENFIRKYLAGIELKITYRRPWAVTGEIAFLCLLSELVDLGLLGPAFVIDTNLGRFFDERLLRSRPVARPSAWVGDLAERSISSGARAWAEDLRIDQVPFAFDRALPEGFVVLLEHAKFLRHEWEMPEEQRLSVLRSPGAVSPESLDPREALTKIRTYQ